VESGLRSKRAVIADADPDGFGRSLQFQTELPVGETPEGPAPNGWYTALSAAPLCELAGASPVFSWTVRVDEWGASDLMLGVVRVDAKCVAPSFSASDQGIGVYMGRGCSRKGGCDVPHESRFFFPQS
jgi:hypothetical protein